MVDLVDGEVELLPGLRLLPCPGHTPGHQAVRIDGGAGRVAYFVGDALHQAQQILEPGLCPVPAARRRPLRVRALLDRASREGALLLSPHLPFPGCGRVRAEGGGRFLWRPAGPGGADSPGADAASNT
ncbi:unnamed protein product, partial [Prorocentrum cordatum]